MGHSSVKSGLNYIFLWFSVKFHLQKRLCVDKKNSTNHLHIQYWAMTNPSEKARWQPTVLLLQDKFVHETKTQFFFPKCNLKLLQIIF